MLSLEEEDEGVDRAIAERTVGFRCAIDSWKLRVYTTAESGNPSDSSTGSFIVVESGLCR